MGDGGLEEEGVEEEGVASLSMVTDNLKRKSPLGRLLFGIKVELS
jgi:hypothetical protein